MINNSQLAKIVAGFALSGVLMFGATQARASQRAISVATRVPACDPDLDAGFPGAQCGDGCQDACDDAYGAGATTADCTIDPRNGWHCCTCEF